MDRGAYDRPCIDEALSIEHGTYADYRALQQHHYRPGRPMTSPRIFVIRDASPTPADRFERRPATPRAIAVLVESLPSLSCWLRDQALGDRYAGLTPRARGMMLNSEVRCISRVIIDPRWRGLGLAVRLVRHALKTAQTPYTEAIAVMGKVSPFFERAGMTAYQRPALPADERALAALRYANLKPQSMAVPDVFKQQLAGLEQTHRALLWRELKRWYRTAGGRGVVREPGLPELLRAARQRLFAQPIYYLHENKHASNTHPGPEHAADPTTHAPPLEQQRDARGAG